MNRQKGFTLIELLVVIGILAILTAVVLVAVNPGRQFAMARNTERQQSVNAILAAITSYMADPINNGALPTGISTLCSVGAHTIGSGTGNLNLGAVVAPTYIAEIPIDPNVSCTAANTCYTVCVAEATASRITVAAPNAELGTIISVTR